VLNELGLNDDAEFWSPNDASGALILNDVRKRLSAGATNWKR
jgi:hypothetical protein